MLTSPRSLLLIGILSSAAGCTPTREAALASGGSNPSDPAAWVGGAPHFSAALRTRLIAADESAAGCSAAAAPPPTTKESSAVVAFFESFPCRELVRSGSERLDVLARLKESNPPSLDEIAVFVRGASPEAERCLDAYGKSRPLTSSVVEHVQFGAKWPRAYAVQQEGGAQRVWVIPTGLAAERAHRLLAQSSALPAPLPIAEQNTAFIRVEEPLFRFLASEGALNVPNGLRTAEAQVRPSTTEQAGNHLEVRATFKSLNDAASFSESAAKIERSAKKAGVAATVKHENESFTFTSELRSFSPCSLVP